LSILLAYKSVPPKRSGGTYAGPAHAIDISQAAAAFADAGGGGGILKKILMIRNFATPAFCCIDFF